MAGRLPRDCFWSGGGSVGVGVVGGVIGVRLCVGIGVGRIVFVVVWWWCWRVVFAPSFDSFFHDNGEFPPAFRLLILPLSVPLVRKIASAARGPSRSCDGHAVLHAGGGSCVSFGHQMNYDGYKDGC